MKYNTRSMIYDMVYDVIDYIKYDMIYNMIYGSIYDRVYIMIYDISDVKGVYIGLNRAIDYHTILFFLHPTISL